MADIDGAVVDAEYDYDYDDPSRTVGELVSRLRFCFRESVLAKVVSVLSARENKMKEEISACDRVNQRLKNELEKLDRDKREAEREAERWKTKWQLLESRIASLESHAEKFKSFKSDVRVSGKNGGNGENVELKNEVVDVDEDAVDSKECVGSAAAVARNARLAREGSGRTPERTIVEISDSDDEVALEESSSRKELTAQRFVNTASPNQTSSQDATEMLKRKLDSSLGVTENDNSDGANIGDTLTCDCQKNELQKVPHVHDGSPDNHGLAADKSVETYFPPSSPDPDQTSSQSATILLKRKLDSSLGVNVNDNNGGANVGDTLTGDCHRNKRQKDTHHVHDGSPANHGSTSDKNVETYVTPSSLFPVSLRQCEKKMGAEHATRDLMSEFLSNGRGGFLYEDSSSSSSSSDSDDGQQDDERWEYEVEVITSLGKDDELCLKAVCALYRQQISLGTSPRNLFSSSRGFNHLDVLRGSNLAKFLIDGDPQGRLKKSVSELLQFDEGAIEDCRKIAIDHAKQLLEIYKKKEDPLFQR